LEKDTEIWLVLVMRVCICKNEQTGSKLIEVSLKTHGSPSKRGSTPIIMINTYRKAIT